MPTYRVSLDDGSSFLLDADLAQASAPLRARFDDPDTDEEGAWRPTPFQTADARHSKWSAAELVNTYFSGDDDDSSVVEVLAIEET